MRAVTRVVMVMGLAWVSGAFVGTSAQTEPSSRAADARLDAGPPEPWLQEDPASRLYQSAREALNRRRYEDAADMFAQIRDDFPRSGYFDESYYWEAFSLYREGSARNLRAARELLAVQQSDYPEARTAAEARALAVRIDARLARGGDADAAEEITRRATGPCGEEEGVRMAALSALVSMNSEQAVPILREVLQSRDECAGELRRRAVFLIAQHLDDESVDILLDLAHRNPDPDPEVRDQAVFWLHQVESPEALEALESILEESSERDLQERAIFAIAQRDEPQAARALRAYAERTDAPIELRENAIFWIGQGSGPEGARYLIDLYPRLDDDELRERAIFAIAQTESPAGLDFLIEKVRDQGESVDVRRNALFWAGQMGGLVGAELQGIYDSMEQAEMKEQVIFVASQMDDAEGVDFLMEVVRSERNQELRERAIFWLGQSDDPRVAEFLLTLVNGRRPR